MIIFGWGDQHFKDFGPIFEMECRECGKNEYWHLYEVSEWVTLYCFRIIPHNREKILMCPVCRSYQSLDAHQFDELLPHAQANKAYLEKEALLTKRKERTQSGSWHNQRSHNSGDHKIVCKHSANRIMQGIFLVVLLIAFFLIIILSESE